MSLYQMLFVLYSLASGLVLGYLWSTPQRLKMKELESQLMWKSALIQSLESDLERCRKKLQALPRKTKKA